MTGPELRSKRTAAGITGAVLCQKAKMARSRLSDIERGYVQPHPDEILRIFLALETLIVAKSVIEQVAVTVGWPVPRNK